MVQVLSIFWSTDKLYKKNTAAQLNNYKDTDCTEQVIAKDGLMEFA